MEIIEIVAQNMMIRISLEVTGNEGSKQIMNSSLAYYKKMDGTMLLLLQPCGYELDFDEPLYSLHPIAGVLGETDIKKRLFKLESLFLM
jgi:hypothetical protein